MLDFLFGLLAGKALFSSKSGNANDDYEKAQIQKVLEIGNAINLMGSTLPPNTDITEAVKKLKIQFDAIDGSAIHNAIGQKNYAAVKQFFNKNGLY